MIDSFLKELSEIVFIELSTISQSLLQQNVLRLKGHITEKVVWKEGVVIYMGQLGSSMLNGGVEAFDVNGFLGLSSGDRVFWFNDLGWFPICYEVCCSLWPGSYVSCSNVLLFEVFLCSSVFILSFLPVSLMYISSRCCRWLCMLLRISPSVPLCL